MATTTTTKYSSTTHPDVKFWAEQVEQHADGRPIFGVMAQAEGFPASEAHPDWFPNLEDAEAVAKALAEGRDVPEEDTRVPEPTGIAVYPEDHYSEEDDAPEQRARFRHTIGAGAFTRN